MAPLPRGLLLGVCAMLIAAAVANTVSVKAASVVIGMAKCADCTRKNMKAETAFKGLQVAIKCKNGNGEYESKAVGEVDSTGAFSVPLAGDLHGADCHAQLHSAAGKPCPGQEPSMIVPQSEDTFAAVPGETHYPSAECGSATICGPIKKHIMDFFHKKKPMLPKPKPEPKPEDQPSTPTPTHGGSAPAPVYHPQALSASETSFCGKIKKHFMDYFHKKPVPPKPKPEPKSEDHSPTPEHDTTTPGGSAPAPTIYHHSTLSASATNICGKIKKKLMDYFHKKSPAPKPKPEPKPEDHPPTPEHNTPTPTKPDDHPPTPEYSTPTPSKPEDHPPTPEHNTPTPSKQDVHPPTPENNTPTPTGSTTTPTATPIYHPICGKIKKHIMDYFHKKPVPPKPKPEPKPEDLPPTPKDHTSTPAASPPPIYHSSTQH